MVHMFHPLTEQTGSLLGGQAKGYVQSRHTREGGGPPELSVCKRKEAPHRLTADVIVLVRMNVILLVDRTCLLTLICCLSHSTKYVEQL